MIAKILIDSSILRAYLHGRPGAKALLEDHEHAPISALSIQEMLEASEASHDLQGLRVFLHSFEALPINVPIAEDAVFLRTRHRINVPCALIWATARQNNLTLLADGASAYKGLSDPSLRLVAMK